MRRIKNNNNFRFLYRIKQCDCCWSYHKVSKAV